MSKSPEMKQMQKAVSLIPKQSTTSLISTKEFFSSNNDYDLYAWLKNEYPLTNIANNLKPKFLTKQPCCINMSSDLCEKAEELVNEFATNLDRSMSSVFSGGRLKPKSF